MATIKQCDHCQSIKDVETLFLETGRRQDAAGAMESTGETIDLCLKCQSVLLRELCKNRPTFSQAAAEIVRGWFEA